MAASENLGDLAVDEAGVGVKGEASLDGLDVGDDRGGGEDGGGNAGGD